MNEPTRVNEGLHRDGHRLLQVGALLFLLSLLVGLAVPRFSLPRLALSTHLLGVMQGTFLLAVGQLWPRLRFYGRVSGIGHGLAIFACAATWTANLLGAMWGAGGSMLTFAAGGALGSGGQEAAIRGLLLSGGTALIATTALIVWGLRGPERS